VSCQGRDARACSKHGEIRYTKPFIAKPDKKVPLGITRRKLKVNIKTNLREIRFEDVDRVYLALDREEWLVFVNTKMNIRVP
jgi:hypothetical protein